MAERNPSRLIGTVAGSHYRLHVGASSSALVDNVHGETLAWTLGTIEGAGHFESTQGLNEPLDALEGRTPAASGE